MPITNEFVIQYLQKIFLETGKVPTVDDFRNSRTKNLPFSNRLVETRFGKWNNAIQLAGLKPNQIHEGKKDVVCDQCGIIFIKSCGEIRNTKHNFCSQSCSGTYNSQHRSFGTRVSKIEIYFREHLTKSYQGLDILFNTRYQGYELDIYFPDLYLAFEINGIFHSKPIYGTEKFQKIIANDKAKKQICLKKGIELVVLDTSLMSKFTLQKGEPFLKIINDKIDQCIFSCNLPINFV